MATNKSEGIKVSRKTKKIILIIAISLTLFLLIASYFYFNRSDDNLLYSANNTEQKNQSLTEVGEIFSIANSTPPQIGEEAPDFSFGVNQEDEVLLSSLQEEKTVLISFWTTWCGACRAKMPHIQEIYEKYDQELQVLSINLQEDKESIINFMEENNYSFPVYRDSGQLGQQYFIHSIPAAFFVDSKGIIRHTHTGLITAEEIEEVLNELKY